MEPTRPRQSLEYRWPDLPGIPCPEEKNYRRPPLRGVCGLRLAITGAHSVRIVCIAAFDPTDWVARLASKGRRHAVLYIRRLQILP